VGVVKLTFGNSQNKYIAEPVRKTIPCGTNWNFATGARQLVSLMVYIKSNHSLFL
jgi:hypothetical protein